MSAPVDAQDAVGGMLVGGSGAIAVAPGWEVTGARSRAAQQALKRALDVLVASLALLLLLPLMAAIAIAITLESPGPVFYSAERVGLRGRPMRMLKFRKMHHHASGLRLTLAADPRFTRVGALLARSKLDELPQFINVLRGDMSLIGPRPEDADFVARQPAEFAEILTVRPGITGPSQIAFADESSILSSEDPIGHYLNRILPQKCALDRMYVRSAGLTTDLRILLWTTTAIIGRREIAVHRETGRMSLRRHTTPHHTERRQNATRQPQH